MPLPALLGPALFSFAPSILSGLFGRGKDPREKFRRESARLFSPANISNLTNQFYQSALASPAFAQAQGAIATGANQTNQGLAAALAARGLGTTGAGAILGSAVPSITGGQLAGLRSSAFGSAQQQAMQSIMQQLAALQGTQGPSQTQQLFAGGLESFAPFLKAYMAKRYPGMFGGMN